jgi:hypothetical protein
VDTFAAAFKSLDWTSPRPEPKLTAREKRINEKLKKAGLREYVKGVDSIVRGVPGRWRLKKTIMMGTPFTDEDMEFVPIAEEE